MKKIQVFHFHNGSGGGVLSVIRNLLRYRQSDQIENHVIYTINSDKNKKYHVPKLEGATTEQVFYYSSKWNFYYTCKKLAKFLPNENAVIVAHDWLELGMASNLGLPNPVVQFVHGAYDYYYSLAVRHSPWIERYITVAQSIADDLTLRLPERNNEIHYLRFPIPANTFNINQKVSGFCIVFVGRCNDDKGYSLLPEIEKLLLKRGVKAKWHIIGEGSESKHIQSIWPTDSDVQFHGNMEHADLMQLLCSSHILILPSKAEGMPVSVVEAMEAGVVPVVNNIRCGLQELIINRVNGFLVVDNSIEEYADIISELHDSKQLLSATSSAAHSYIMNLFNPDFNSELIENIIIESRITKNKKSQKIYGSNLDRPFLPNVLTVMLRKFS